MRNLVRRSAGPLAGRTTSSSVLIIIQAVGLIPGGGPGMAVAPNGLSNAATPGTRDVHFVDLSGSERGISFGTLGDAPPAWTSTR